MSLVAPDYRKIAEELAEEARRAVEREEYRVKKLAEERERAEALEGLLARGVLTNFEAVMIADYLEAARRVIARLEGFAHAD